GTLASSVVAASSFFDSDGIDGLGGFGDSSFGIGSPFEGVDFGGLKGGKQHRNKLKDGTVVTTWTQVSRKGYPEPVKEVKDVDRGANDKANADAKETGDGKVERKGGAKDGDWLGNSLDDFGLDGIKW
ncbi:hypothetical protein JCM10212_000337, partial [Sporobolomyces blumeae]